MGRSAMRGESSKVVRPAAKDATDRRNRNAVPALPTGIGNRGAYRRPPVPSTRNRPGSARARTPS
jgi:hypothetical protein